VSQGGMFSTTCRWTPADGQADVWLTDCKNIQDDTNGYPGLHLHRCPDCKKQIELVPIDWEKIA